MARGKAHSEELRQQVIAALMAGLGISEVARQYSLPKATVSRIKHELAPERLEQVGTETRNRLDELLVDALAANLAAQRRIAETASEPDYIRKQGASAVSELYGALADKAVRLLEAASFGDDTAADEGDGEGASG